MKTLPALIDAAALGSPVILAQTGLLFKRADLGLSEKLTAEHKCPARHARRAGGDSSAM